MATPIPKFINKMQYSKQNSYQLLSWLLKYVTPYYKYLFISLIFLVLVALSEPILPALLKPLLDEGFIQEQEGYVKWIPLLLVTVFFLRGVLIFSSSYISSWIGNKITNDIRERMFKKMIWMPAEFFDNHSSTKTSSYIASLASSVTSTATSVLTILVRDSITVAALTAWLLYLNWKMTLIFVSIFPLVAITVRFFNKRLRHISRASQAASAQLLQKVEEAYTNNRVVKVYCAEDHELDRFRDENEKQRLLAMKTTIASSAITPIVQTLASITIAIIIYLAMDISKNSVFTAGSFVSFLTAILMLLPVIKRLTDVTSTIQKGLAAAELIYGFLNEPDEKTETSTSAKGPSGDILFHDVSFGYKTNALTLSSVSLSIPEGKTYALVGQSGSGKTTITQLLCGFYRPSSGSIFIGATPLSTISGAQIRKSISFVSQDIKLFDDTIANNVSYPSPPNRTKLMKALEAANASEFVAKLPDGIDTNIGQNGVLLSGGQRQRIAIARAFYKESPILILDEATSALDNESENAIKDALARLAHGKTTLIVAHRLSTIENADQIVVLSNGKIVEHGTHKELLERPGPYRSLYLSSEIN